MYIRNTHKHFSGRARARPRTKRSGAVLIKFYTPLGKVCMTGDFFAGLVSAAAQNCYGVAGMATSSRAENVK